MILEWNDDFPHFVIIPIHLFDVSGTAELYKWLDEEIGVMTVEWVQNGELQDHPFSINMYYQFKSEEDKVKFILRWL